MFFKTEEKAPKPTKRRSKSKRANKELPELKIDEEEQKKSKPLSNAKETKLHHAGKGTEQSVILLVLEFKNHNSFLSMHYSFERALWALKLRQKMV